MRVRDVMSTDVTTVAPDTDLRDVAALFVQKRISDGSVVDGERVVGVVLERDILFRERPSTGLQRGVLAWLMDEGDLMLKIEATTAHLAMTSPLVTSGKVDSKQHARAIEAFVDRVPGVVSVASRSQWEGRQ